MGKRTRLLSEVKNGIESHIMRESKIIFMLLLGFLQNCSDFTITPPPLPELVCIDESQAKYKI